MLPRSLPGADRNGTRIEPPRCDITLTKPIQVLGIPAGTHNVQRLLYYNFVKCFWNEAFDFETNNMINFDWYYPHDAWQHTPAEVECWLRSLVSATTSSMMPIQTGFRCFSENPVGKIQFSDRRVAMAIPNNLSRSHVARSSIRAFLGRADDRLPGARCVRRQLAADVVSDRGREPKAGCAFHALSVRHFMRVFLAVATVDRSRQTAAAKANF